MPRSSVGHDRAVPLLPESSNEEDLASRTVRFKCGCFRAIFCRPYWPVGVFHAGSEMALSTLSGHPRLPVAVIQFGRGGHLNQHPIIYAGVKLLGKIGLLHRMFLAGKTRRPRNDTAEAAAQCAQPRTAFRSCVETRSAARGRACVPACGVPRRRAAQVNSGTASIYEWGLT
jgi:hypothetical protein